MRRRRSAGGAPAPAADEPHTGAHPTPPAGTPYYIFGRPGDAARLFRAVLATVHRTTLCAWHHLRGVHAGVVRCTGRAPHGLRFELGVHPGRLSLAVYRSGDVAC